MKKTIVSLILLGFITLPGISFGAQEEENVSNVPGCMPTFLFSPLSGQPCSEFPPGCTATYLFSITTGKPCSSSNNLPAGCLSMVGYSATTGTKCDGTISFRKEISDIKDSIKKISESKITMPTSDSEEEEEIIELSKPKIGITDVDSVHSEKMFSYKCEEETSKLKNISKLTSGCRYEFGINVSDTTSNSKLVVKTDSPDGFNRINGYSGDQSPTTNEQTINVTRNGRFNLTFEPVTEGSFYLSFSLDGRTTTENFSVGKSY